MQDTHLSCTPTGTDRCTTHAEWAQRHVRSQTATRRMVRLGLLTSNKNNTSEVDEGRHVLFQKCRSGVCAPVERCQRQKQARIRLTFTQKNTGWALEHRCTTALCKMVLGAKRKTCTTFRKSLVAARFFGTCHFPLASTRALPPEYSNGLRARVFRPRQQYARIILRLTQNDICWGLEHMCVGALLVMVLGV